MKNYLAFIQKGSALEICINGELLTEEDALKWVNKQVVAFPDTKYVLVEVKYVTKPVVQPFNNFIPVDNIKNL